MVNFEQVNTGWDKDIATTQAIGYINVVSLEMKLSRRHLTTSENVKRWRCSNVVPTL